MERNDNSVPYRVFVIAGSEPLGSAGLQADIKAITACGGYAAGALTCVVDEDTTQVKSIFTLPLDLVVGQTESFLKDIGADCMKTGMLYSGELISAVADVIKKYESIPLVADPVLVTALGDKLVDDWAVDAYKTCLFPLATMITPNKREAELLLGRALNPCDIRKDLQDLVSWGNTSVLLKSVPFNGYLADYFYHSKTDFCCRYVKTIVRSSTVSGTGDLFSASIAAFLAQGENVCQAVNRAETFIDQAIRSGAAYSFGKSFVPLALYPDHFALQSDSNGFVCEIL